jgi:hypothetical protein
MIQFYKFNEGVLECLGEYCSGSWINLIDPTKEEL